MAFEVTMPQMGADMTEGTLIKWFKQVGEQVHRGDILAEIETDKANVELEAFKSGNILKHVVAEGEVVPVGEVIALIGEASEKIGEVERKPAAETPARRKIEEEAAPAAAEPAQKGAADTAVLEKAEEGPATGPTEAPPELAKVQPTGTDSQPAAPANGRVRISPVAKRIASQAGLDLAALIGSGPDGRILRRDVEAALGGKQTAAAEAPATPQPAPAAPTPATPTPTPAAPAPRAGAPSIAGAPAPAPTPAGLSKMRQAIARRMTLSKQTEPHYYLTLDIDMTAAMKFREQLNGSASEAQRVSINDLVVKACAIALERHPKFNAAFAENGLVMHSAINIDIGIALDDGLIAPAILDCGRKSLGHIATESKDLIERAKAGRLRADEYSEGTFTITNLGAYGVETLIGIINPPQAAILGVGSVMDHPVVRDGQVVAAKVMKVALSADHRVTDGAEGARFIKEIQSLLEKPVSLAL